MKLRVAVTCFASLGLILGVPACKDKSKKKVADAGGPKQSKLTFAEKDRISVVMEDSPLLNVVLADALVGLPKDHADRVVAEAYPNAAIKKDNPRVNKLFGLQDAGGIASLDLRWSRVRKKRIGSVVFSYGKGVDMAALSAAIKKEFEAVEGDERTLLGREQYARLRVTFFPENMDGETVVSFELRDLEGAPISRSDDAMKQAEQWKVNQGGEAAEGATKKGEAP